MGRPGNYQEKTFSNRYVQSRKQQSSRLSHHLFAESNSGYALQESESRLLLSKYNTEFAKSSSFSFIAVEQRYGTPSHIILELLPSSLLLKNK